MDQQGSSWSNAINLWRLKLVESSDTDDMLIVSSETLGFYFEWPANLFQNDLLRNLGTTPLDFDIGASSYSAPGHGLSPKDGRRWIIYFVRITETLLSPKAEETERLEVWLRQVIFKLPINWLQHRIWRSVLADAVEQIVLHPWVDGNVIQRSGGKSAEGDDDAEIEALIQDIKAFRSLDLEDLCLAD